MHSMLWWSFPIQSILECLNCAVTYCPQDGLVPLTERMESSQVGHPYLSTPFAEVHTWVCQTFSSVTRYIWVVMILGFDMHDACKQQLLRIGESRSGGCSRRLGVRGRGDPVFLDLANPPRSFLRRKVFPEFLPVFLVGKREEVNWFQIFVCQSCELGYWNCVPNIAEAVGSEKLRVVCNANLDSFVEEKTWFDLHLLWNWGCQESMGRSSRGAHGSKLDWSKHEKAWADLLHKEIFETGRYFRKTEVKQFKSKPKTFVGKKNRESPEEDEGYEVGIIN